MPIISLTDLDTRIWQEELNDFVPQRVYDIHTHLYSWRHNLDPNKASSGYAKLLGEQFAEATTKLADECDALLMPGRDVARLSFPFPFPHPCDFVGANAFVAEQAAKNAASASLMLVHPGLGDDEVERELDLHGHLGFKPYRWYSSTGDAVNCRITDFMSERQIAIADRRGLMIMMHVSKRDAIADEENLRDLTDLSERYPNAKWILAHCARSYSAWALERAASRLRKLPNVWYDTSSVCETDAMDALYQGVGCDRVMYASDDIPVGVLRGKYIAFGYAWAYLSETNHSVSLAHCDGRMTFTRYEQLRAMRRASRRLNLSASQIQALFYDTAAELVRSARKGNGK
jgi:glutamate-1-semialdehyde 2,1-aminomutase